MTKIKMRYLTYKCCNGGGECFPDECDDPRDARYWCREYNDIEKTKDGMKIIHYYCMYASPVVHIICKTISSFEYHEGQCAVIGRKEYDCDFIESLYVDGVKVFGEDWDEGISGEGEDNREGHPAEESEA